MRPSARLVMPAILLVALLSGCERNPAPSTSDPGTIPSDGVTPPPADAPAAPAPAEQGGTDDWRKLVSAADASALGRLDQAWRLARAEAEDAGFADQVEALGPLVDPNAGQAGRLQPAPGA
jgi:hypothetical protein